MFKNVIGAVAALSMVAMPAIASAAPTSPAASLSVSKSVRTGSTTSANSKIGGGSGVILALAIVAGIVAIGVIAATKDDNVGTPTSR